MGARRVAMRSPCGGDRRELRLNSFTPSSDSSEVIRRVTEETATRSRLATFEKLPSLATATKVAKVSNIQSFSRHFVRRLP